jgi:PAS domain S-box-containing protein
MKRLFTLILLAGASLEAQADIFAVFRDAQGRTNWQYVANTSASLLILILLIVLGFLIRAHWRATRANKALTEIKATLEQRVAQRTAVLQATTEQLQKSEAYISSIVDSMPVMLIGLNQQLQVTRWNKTAEQITGRPLNDVVGKNLWEAYTSITLTADQVLKVLTSGETLHLKHTQRGQYSFDITLYRLEGNEDTGIVILISDITKQVNAENKVSERDKISALGELASAMAYDISLPIDSILTHAANARQIIEAADLGPVKGFLLQEMTVVGEGARQASAISQNLLDLARSHRNDEQPADVVKIMERSIALATTLFSSVDGLAFKDIDIRRQYAESLPPIQCIPAELEQVFVRLLRSAFYALRKTMKDTDQDDIAWIRIEIDEFFDSLWIKIMHQGQCLCADEQEDIFEPFFAINARPAACPVEQRLSYPFFIITEHHQGHLSVTSGEDLGTCFNIQLPPASHRQDLSVPQ